MRNVLMVRFGEVHLKGLNRPYFMKKLVDDIIKEDGMNIRYLFVG